MNLDTKKIYIRLRHRIEVKMGQVVLLQDCCQFIASPSRIKKTVGTLPIYRVTPDDKHLVVLDIMKVIEALKSFFTDVEIESFGANQVIIEIVNQKNRPNMLLVLFVCLLLFVGSGLAIMNFHEDVSMLGVHQKIYKIITGEEKEHPLLLQIPYSIGIGIGMILFFNHLFKKRFNEEPSPLEVEMFLYQQNLDQYVAMFENKEAQKKLNDEPD
ncbi:stage V sporulation protein AA [Bacillus horti]|uniref:Stage V sporulation protein AA n=1 Tax=Caldalkalibacillus horti TaxID=77523 RepID=A0ABT9VU73_9BACI|nr:stage V sporulation protein AA [Bacillus horti]MDQ0164538.1 stage V sporulation protein AA [Bacillus horti]